MIRLFQRHSKRNVFSLDGMWKFKTDPERIGMCEKWFQAFPEDSTDMVVPSCWNNELGLYDYEGMAWYSTTFESESNILNLIFNAVTGQAEVYLDGVHLGGHYGGWTGFNFVVKDLSPGKHTLVIAIDNTHNDIDTIPLAKVDWYHYGGIPRSVEVAELKDVWIKNYRIDYQLDDSLKNASIILNVALEGLTPGIHNRTLNIYINDEKLFTLPVAVNGLTQVPAETVTMKNVKLWDIGKPNLYHVKFEISEDDVVDRIGFRQIKAEDRKIFLNGREIYLKGVNRHEDHPDWGFAFPFKLMKKDMDIIKQMGCNAIRGSHYPNSELFLDYCDQDGMVFWEEIPMWQYFERHFNNPVVVDRGLMMLEEMVTRDYHHPSIIIWSVHNEVDTSIPVCYEMTKSFVEKVRSIDSTRLISYASDKPLRDICFSLVDIVSVNKYYGWYENTLEYWGTFLDELDRKLKADGLEHLPVIMSEFGAAGIYGDCTFEAPKWTENYQEKFLEYTLSLFSKHPMICGSYIWQYADIRTAKELELGRARSFNNKGILNEYRKPKMAYWTAKEIYEGIK